MQDAHPNTGESTRGQVRRHVEHSLGWTLIVVAEPVPRRLVVGLGITSDAGADHVGLAPAADLLDDAGPGALEERGLLGARNDVRRDRGAAGRELGEGRDLEVTEHRHGHRARNRSRGHHQHVRTGIIARLRGQSGPLFDAEPVLLVDHHEPEILERDLVLEQRVGADDDSRVATRDVEHRLTTLGGRR